MWIGDVFGRERAENIELGDIPKLFFRTRAMDVLERADNHIVLGSKGSGKSTALRALTLQAWQRRTPSQRLPFCGIYQPMSYDDVNLFRTAYAERNATDLFEHFLVVAVLHQIAIQLHGIVGAAVLAGLFDPFVTTAPRDEPHGIETLLLEDKYKLLSAVRSNPVAHPQEVGGHCRTLTVLDLRLLAERYRHIAVTTSGLPPRLGILFDSFDYYGLLGSVLCPLFQSDSGTPLSVTVAARTLNVSEVFEAAPTRPLEPRRDFHVVSLDRNGDDDDYIDMVRGAVCRRVRRFGPDGVQRLSDDQILAALFNGSEEDLADLTSFMSFCRLSSGNLLSVFILLDKAAELQRAVAATQPSGLTPLLRMHRLKAVIDLSNQFWDFEIGVRLPSQRVDATVFAEVALACAKQSTDGLRGAPQFTITAVAPEKPLLTNMLATRVLTPVDANLSRHVQSGFPVSTPVTFELNRLLLPKHDLLPLPGPAVTLERVAFATMFKKALRTAKPHISPRSAHSSGELFSRDFCVFISVPFDRRKQARTAVVRRSINRIYVAQTGVEGGPGKSYVDIHFLPSAGAFRTEIAAHLRDATYVIADISDVGTGDPVPGVFFEIGLAVGYGKPFAMFYNGRERGAPAFRVADLPALLRGQTVLVWSAKSEVFHQRYQRVHEMLLGYQGTITDSKGPDHSGPYAYIGFEPRNVLAAELVNRVLRQHFPEVRVERTRQWREDDLVEARRLISGARLALVDCTGRVNDQAFELGIAAAAVGRSVVEVWDSGAERTVNPVAMFQGHKWAWADLDADDEKQLSRLLQDIGRATSLGSRRR